METSAITDTPNLTDSQVLELLKERRPAPVPATQPERWNGAACLFIVFLVLAIASRVSEYFKVMCEEMELGTLPELTNWVMAWSTLQLNSPWIFTSGMFAVSWIYFSWVCKDRRRTMWFGPIALLVAFGLAFVLAVALFLPFMSRFDRIG